MKLGKANLEKARTLLCELSNLEDALKVLDNYDSQISVKCVTFYNDNSKVHKEVSIPLPPDSKIIIRTYINDRIFQIKEELRSM